MSVSPAIATRQRLRRAVLAFLLVAPLCVAVLPRPAWGAEGKKSSGPRIYRLAKGESHRGDLYLYSASIEIDGVQDGDLTAFTQSVTITGEVTGDMYLMAHSITIDGKVGDSVRLFASEVNITGTIHGDVVAFAGDVTIAPKAHVTGDVQAYAGHVVVDGIVDGSLKATGGSVVLGGKVAGDTHIKSDEVDIGKEARVGGDLTYTSRNRLELEGKGIVAGDIDYMEKKKEEGRSLPTVGKFFKWIWCTSAGLVAGLVALALFRRWAPEILGALSGDTLRSAGIGFIAAIVVPVAAAISCVLIITIPLAILVLLVYLVVLYLAKVPVGVWLGRRVFQALGRTDPSPYWSLTAGILLLYLVFSIPFLGKLTWFACLFLGLGAIVLGTRAYVQAQRASGPRSPAPQALAGSS